MKRQILLYPGGFSETEINQSTGISAKISTAAIAMLQRAYSRLPRSIYFTGLPSSTLVPSTRT